MRRNLNKIMVACVLMALCKVHSASASEVVLKAITYAPVSQSEDDVVIFKKWVDKVNANGKGELRIQILGGPEVFPVGGQINALSKGLVDIVMTFGVHAPIVPEINTAELSEITPSEERANGYLALLDKAHEKINVKVLGRTGTNSGFYIFSKQPIRTLADFKNMKIRSHSGYDPLFKKVCAVPIGMAISEIYGALERGVVAAAPYPIFVYDMGLQQVAKYVLDDPFWTAHTTFTFINRKTFDRLTAKQQKILTDAQIESERDMASVESEMIAAEKAKLQGAGMTFTHLPPGEDKLWHEMAKETIFDELSTKIKPDELTKIKSLILRKRPQ